MPRSTRKPEVVNEKCKGILLFTNKTFFEKIYETSLLRLNFLASWGIFLQMHL